MGGPHLERLKELPPAGSVRTPAMQHVPRHAMRAERCGEQARQRYGGGVPLAGPAAGMLFVRVAGAVGGEGVCRCLKEEEVGACEREERGAESDDEDEVAADVVGDAAKEFVMREVTFGVEHDAEHAERGRDALQRRGREERAKQGRCPGNLHMIEESVG